MALMLVCVGKISYIINPKRLTDYIRKISPVLLAFKRTKNHRASDLLRRAQEDTLRCEHPSRLKPYSPQREITKVHLALSL